MATGQDQFWRIITLPELPPQLCLSEHIWSRCERSHFWSALQMWTFTLLLAFWHTLPIISRCGHSHFWPNIFTLHNKCSLYKLKFHCLSLIGLAIVNPVTKTFIINYNIISIAECYDMNLNHKDTLFFYIQSTYNNCKFIIASNSASSKDNNISWELIQ